MVVLYECGVCGWKQVVPILPASVPLFYLQTQWRLSSSLVNPRYKGGSASLVSCPACSVLKHGKNFTKNFSLDRVLLDLLFQQLHFSHRHWQYNFRSLKTLIELAPHELSKSSIWPMYWNTSAWTMGLEHKRYVCTQGGIQTFFLGDCFKFNSRCCVFLSFLNVYDISSSLLSNIHPLSILCHITVKPVSHALYIWQGACQAWPHIYIYSIWY